MLGTSCFIFCLTLSIDGFIINRFLTIQKFTKIIQHLLQTIHFTILG